jgi:hypothetical protein
MTDDDHAETHSVPNGPLGVAGGAHRANVTPLRLPGQAPPEAYPVALERLFEAMCLTSTINREAYAAFAVMFRTCAVSAPYGEQGAHVTKILQGLARRLEAHLATLPNQPPPAA